MVWLLLILKIFFKDTIHHEVLRSSKKNLPVVPAFNLNSYGHHAFSVVALLLCNSLPQNIRDAESLDTLKRRLMGLFKFMM